MDVVLSTFFIDRAADLEAAIREQVHLARKRVPLQVLTPLSTPEVQHLRYRVVIHDVDVEGQPAVPTLELSGSLRLDPPMTVPAAVRERGSVRICLASQSDALWGYENGWRCAIPYRRDVVRSDDTAALLPPGYRAWAALPDLAEARFYAEREWLDRCADAAIELILPVSALSVDQMQAGWRRCRHVLVV